MLMFTFVEIEVCLKGNIFYDEFDCSENFITEEISLRPGILIVHGIAKYLVSTSNDFVTSSKLYVPLTAVGPCFSTSTSK